MKRTPLRRGKPIRKVSAPARKTARTSYRQEIARVRERGARLHREGEAKAFRKAKVLCRVLVVELRDRNQCQRCGKRGGRLEWAHVKTRNARSLICNPWNSLALCGPRLNSSSCHGWWHNNIEAAMEWWRATFPERALALDAWQRARNRPKIDRRAECLWLEQELAKSGTHREPPA